MDRRKAHRTGVRGGRSRALATWTCLLAVLLTAALAGGPGRAAVATGKIAFVRNNDIWTMNADGTGATNLTTSPGQNDVAPSLSADGTKIIFQTDRFSGGTPDVAVMNADGTGPARVVLDAREPTWSPDGTRFAYVANRDGLISSIYVASADGTNETRVTNAFPASDDQPAWSPDGTRIAFWTNQGAIGLRIGLVNADGTGRTLFDPAGANWTAPAWSPDGTRIAARRSDPLAVDTAIFVINANGTAPTRLTAGNPSDDHPTWSPDGLAIAFDRNVAGRPQLFVMNADGTAQTNISNSTTSDSAPSWAAAIAAKAPTTTTLASSVNPSVFGELVTFTATVTTAGTAAQAPTGAVTFSDATTALASVQLAGGVAQLSVALGVGPHAIAATYSGDGAFGGSASPALTQNVDRASTDTSLSASPNPASDTTLVTLTALVVVVGPGAGTPTGSVTFFDGATALGSVPLNTSLVTFKATFSAGSHTLTAVYGGDASFVGTTSPPVTLAVQSSVAVVNVSEQIGVSDAVSVVPPAVITIGETVSVTDAAAILPPAIVSVSEAVGVSDAVAIQNTLPGSNVAVLTRETRSGASATVTFGTVLIAGLTTLATTTTGAAPPVGFSHGTPVRYYDLATTAGYAPPVRVCIDVSAIAFGGAPRLFHLEGGAWVDHTVSFNVASHVVCGTVSSLSPFLVAYDTAPPVTTAVADPAPNAAGWNRSTVTVRLTAVDQPSNGSGVREIIVRATGATSFDRTVAGGATSIAISNEGTTMLRYFARDNNGNEEAARELTVRVDTTPPEARIRFDPTTLDVTVLGLDQGSGIPTDGFTHDVVRRGDREERSYRIADRAGNELELVLIVKHEGHDLKASVERLGYGGATPRPPALNELAFEWSLAPDGSLKELEQRMSVGTGSERFALEAKFDARSGTTTIRAEPRDGGRTTRAGLVLLELTTDHGALALGVAGEGTPPAGLNESRDSELSA